MSSSEKGQVQGSSTGTGGERGEETIGEEEDDWLTMATGFKDAGNAAFQKGDIEEAISLYSQAIALNPDDHVYYSNRSAAYMKASSISKALHDGEKCVELKPDWGKGYNRLGVAQQGLRRFEQAVATFKIGLRLEPGNNAMWDALRACEESQVSRCCFCKTSLTL